MYFPIGWPKVIKIPESGQGALKQIKCNRDRILVAILTEDSLAVWFCKVSLQKGHSLINLMFFKPSIALSGQV